MYLIGNIRQMAKLGFIFYCIAIVVIELIRTQSIISYPFLPRYGCGHNEIGLSCLTSGGKWLTSWFPDMVVIRESRTFIFEHRAQFRKRTQVEIPNSNLYSVTY